MVKASETKGHVSFSQSDCESWVELPTDLIAQAERLNESECGDHAHPVMSITLKQPSDPQAKVLLSLLMQQISDPRYPTTLAETFRNQQQPYLTRSMQTATPLASTSTRMRRPAIYMRRSPFRRPVRGIGGVFDPSSTCCCVGNVTICEGDYCWPATINMCISCPDASDCGCDANGPYCQGPMPV
jgi:hypothetical protein